MAQQHGYKYLQGEERDLCLLFHLGKTWEYPFLVAVETPAVACTLLGVL